MSIDTEALKARTDIVAVVGSYLALKKLGAEYVGLCPFHADTNPSLTVSPAKQFCYCFSCGASHDVIGFVQAIEGISFQAACEKLGATNNWQPKGVIQQLARKRPERTTSKPPPDAGMPKMTLAKLGEPTHTFPILDSGGSLLGVEARYVGEDGKKEIRMWTWGARGDEPPGWGCGHFTAPRPLYGLERLAQRPDVRVSIFEGPKKALAAVRLLPAYACISWTGGAQAWHKHAWDALRGRKVLLWPDADKPGWEACDKLAAHLDDPKGLGCAVRIVDTHGMPEGWDVADAEAEGWDSAKLTEWAKPRAYDYVRRANPEPPGPPPEDSPPVEAYNDEPAAAPKRKPRRRLTVVNGGAAPAPDADAAPLPVEMSEDALAEHLASEYGKDWRYVARWGRWFKWGGDVWREDDTNEIFGLAREVCRASVYWAEAASLSPDAKRKISRKATAGNVRDMAGTDRRIAATTDQWDTDPWLLGIPGGVVDLRTGKTMDGEPEQYITKKCSVAPIPGPHPLFDKVLGRACGGDEAMRPYLMRFIGYMLTGDVREECFLFLHGPGGSGKGTLVKCLADIMGDYARTISMEALVESKSQRHPQELAKLDRARFVYASETEEGRRWNESLIKWLTGRDKVTAHYMRENDFEFYPQFKLLIYGNHIPHLKSVGEEMRRRVHLIEYAGSLAEEERDSSLKDRLVAEYPAILATMIRGCIEWQDCGLGKPERVSNSTEGYLESEDTLGIWLEDNVERVQYAKVLSGDVYRDFKRWADSAGEYVMAQKRFVQAMRQRGFESVRANGKRYLEGIKLKNPPQFSNPQHHYSED